MPSVHSFCTELREARNGRIIVTWRKSLTTIRVTTNTFMTLILAQGRIYRKYTKVPDFYGARSEAKVFEPLAVLGTLWRVYQRVPGVPL